MINDRLREAKEDLDRAEAERINAIFDAYSSGMSIQGIARAAGLARQTVYNVIDRLALVRGVE